MRLLPSLKLKGDKMHSFQDAYKFLLYCRLGQVERLTIKFMKVPKIS